MQSRAGAPHVGTRACAQRGHVAGSWFLLHCKVLTPTTTRRWPAVGGLIVGPGRVARFAPPAGGVAWAPPGEPGVCPPRGAWASKKKGLSGRVCGVEWMDSGRPVDVQWTLQWTSQKWGFRTVDVKNFGKEDIDIPQSEWTSTVERAPFVDVHCNVHWTSTGRPLYPCSTDSRICLRRLNA